MSRWMSTGVALCLLALGSMGCGDKGSDESAQGAGGTATGTPGGEIIETRSITGTIISIDHDTRDVAIQGPEGNILMFEARPEVKNLDQVHAGDEITVNYLESLAVHVRGKHDPAPQVGEYQTMAVAAAGDKPAMMMTDTQETMATVVSVDSAERRLVLKGSDGELVDLEVSPRVKLDQIKAGDELIVTHTEAVGVSVHSPR